MISERYAPEPNIITASLAEGLMREGHCVTVVAPHPNYPGGKFYPSVNSLWPKFSIENGVKVWRLPMIPYHGKSKSLRGLSYISFLTAALSWVLLTQIWKLPNRIIVYQTPFTTALAALPFKLFGSRLAYICVDLWPESFEAAGVAPSRAIMKILYVYSRWINRRADVVITSTQGMRRRYLLDGLPEDKVHFVPVWVDGLPQTLPPLAPKLNFPRRIVYAGNIGPSQNLDILIQALMKLSTHELQALEIDIFGSGTEIKNLTQKASMLNSCKIQFHGRVSPEAAFAALTSSTCSFIHLVPSPLFRMTLPSKIAACLASGTFVLCGVDGEANELLADGGFIGLFPSGNSQLLAEQIRSMLKMTDSEILTKAEGARTLYKRYFDRDVLLKKYVELCAN